MEIELPQIVMQTIPMEHGLLLAAILFVLGLVGGLGNGGDELVPGAVGVLDLRGDREQAQQADGVWDVPRFHGCATKNSNPINQPIS